MLRSAKLSQVWMLSKSISYLHSASSPQVFLIKRKTSRTTESRTFLLGSSQFRTWTHLVSTQWNYQLFIKSHCWISLCQSLLWPLISHTVHARFIHFAMIFQGPGSLLPLWSILYRPRQSGNTAHSYQRVTWTVLITAVHSFLSNPWILLMLYRSVRLYQRKYNFIRTVAIKESPWNVHLMWAATTKSYSPRHDTPLITQILVMISRVLRTYANAWRRW